jgi:phage baseplate assembly protein W
MRELGTDLALQFGGAAGLYEDADLGAGLAERAPRRRDLHTVSALAAAEQLLVNRLKTQQGELAPLGHPEYGSRHHQLIGEPNVERTRNLIKLHVLEALSHEPRIQKVLACRVFAPHRPPRSEVRIELELRLIDQPSPLNLVIPFSLEVAP